MDTDTEHLADVVVRVSLDDGAHIDVMCSGYKLSVASPMWRGMLDPSIDAAADDSGRRILPMVQNGHAEQDIREALQFIHTETAPSTIVRRAVVMRVLDWWGALESWLPGVELAGGVVDDLASGSASEAVEMLARLPPAVLAHVPCHTLKMLCTARGSDDSRFAAMERMAGVLRIFGVPRAGREIAALLSYQTDRLLEWLPLAADFGAALEVAVLRLPPAFLAMGLARAGELTAERYDALVASHDRLFAWPDFGALGLVTSLARERDGRRVEYSEGAWSASMTTEGPFWTAHTFCIPVPKPDAKIGGKYFSVSHPGLGTVACTSDRRVTVMLATRATNGRNMHALAIGSEDDVAMMVPLEGKRVDVAFPEGPARQPGTPTSVSSSASSGGGTSRCIYLKVVKFLPWKQQQSGGDSDTDFQ